MAARAQSDPPETKTQARKRTMGQPHTVAFLYEANRDGVFSWSGICQACKATFTAETGMDLEVLADEHEAYLMAAVAQEGIPTPGCDCDHVGFGKAWHKRSCVWAKAQPAAAGRGKGN